MTENFVPCLLLFVFVSGHGTFVQNRNQHTKTTELFPYPHTPPGNSTTCGGVLTEAPYGGIFYKPQEFVGSNERCVWTIFYPKASGFNVIVHQFGYTPTSNVTKFKDHGIILSAFGRGRAPEHIVPRTMDSIHLTNSSVLMVTFYSGATNQDFKGIILQYTILFNGSMPQVSPRSRHVISEPNRYYMRHPDVGNADVYELSTFVLLPKDCTYTSSATKHNSLIVADEYFNPNQCQDQIKLYRFNGSSYCSDEFKWHFVGRLCGRIPDFTEIIFTAGEPILAVLETASTRTSFRFIYA